MPEKRDVIAVKRGVVAKTALIADRACLITLGDHLLRQKQPLFHNILFRSLVELLLEESEKIAFADEKMVCDLFDSRQSAEVFIGVFQCRGNKRRESRLLGMRQREETDMIKKLGEQMREQLLKGLAVAVLVIQIALFENVLDDAVACKIYDLHIGRDPVHALDTVLVGVEKHVVPFVFRGSVYLDKMILKGSDQYQIALFQFVFSILDDVSSVAVEKIDQLVGIVSVHKISVAGQIFGDLVLEIDAVGIENIFV